MTRWLPSSIAVLLAMACLHAHAQELEISVSPSPVGSGARAAGMADAFVAVADDATAASWNPAGLIQLERPEIAIAFERNDVFDRFNPPNPSQLTAQYGGFSPGTFVIESGSLTERDFNHSGALNLNFLSVTYPMPFQIAERNAVAGIYLQNEYDFSRSFELPVTLYSRFGGGIQMNAQRLKFKQEGSLNALTFAYAMEITQKLSVGLAANLYRNWGIAENGWKQTIDRSILNATPFSWDYGGQHAEETYEDFRGQSVTVGLLWNVSPKWNIGLRYDSALEAKADHAISVSSWDKYWSANPQYLPLWYNNTRSSGQRDIRFPSTLALGVATRLNDRTTLSLDISRTDWNGYWYEENGRRVSLVNASPLNTADSSPPHFDPTYTIRAGVEHVFIPRVLDTQLDRLWTLRAGLFYDPEPATGKPDPFYGAAFGVGLLLSQRINIDVAWQVRYGQGVNADFNRGVRGLDEDFIQNRVLVSTIVYF